MEKRLALITTAATFRSLLFCLCVFFNFFNQIIRRQRPAGIPEQNVPFEMFLLRHVKKFNERNPRVLTGGGTTWKCVDNHDKPGRL